MNARNPGRVRQTRKERPFKERQRDTSTESTRSTSSRNDSRIDIAKNRKQRENKADEQVSRARDKNYDIPNRVPPADLKDRGKNENLRRSEKSSGFREKNNALVQSRDGYRDSTKDRRVGNFSDDSPLSLLIRQINKESDSEKRLATAKKLEEFVNQPTNFQAVIKVVDEILSFAEAIFRERNPNTFELKDQIAKCVGIITGLLGAEAKGFIFLLISKVESASSEEHKSLLIKILTKAVEQDEKKHRFKDFIPLLLTKLHNILENADTSDLLHSVLSIIMPIAVEYPQVFTPHFRDTVDILIGWHIDTKQPNQLVQFTSDCLISLHRYWVADINFSLTLLTQFLEDMEAYSEELKYIATGQLDENQVSPPYSSLPKLTALVRVFTTVMNGIGECFTPTRSPTITQEYITKLSKGVIDCVRSGGYSFFYEDLFKTANECFGIMCCFLKNQFSSSCEMTTEFALEQLERKSLTFAHTKSILAFVKQVIKHVNAAIPDSFVMLLLNPDSAIMKLRFCADEEILKRLIEICQCLINIKSVSLMERTYEIFVKDIRTAYSQLKENINEDGQDGDDVTLLTQENVERNSSAVAVRESGDHADDNMSSEVKLYQAQVKTVFDLQVLGSLNLSQPSNTNPVWRVSPSLVELFTKEMSPTDWDIAFRFPAVQYTILCSLYDHCKRNKYFREDSAANRNKSEVEIIGKVQEMILEILQNAFSSCDIRMLCIAWIVDLVELANSSEDAISIDFDAFLEGMLPLSYLPDEDVRLTASVCIKLMIQNKLLSNDCIKRSFQECVFHITDVYENIRDTFIHLLTAVPVDLAISFGPHRSSCDHLNSRCDSPLKLSIIGSWLARKIHMMKPSTITFHSHNFRVVSSFILHGVLPPKEESPDWLLHLYHTCQRRSQEKQHNHPMNDKYYFSSKHDPNSVVSISSNYALLWFWATWEMAQFCVLARLKTPLGRAQDTFQAIESVLREFMSQVCPDQDKKTIRIKKKTAPQEPAKTSKESSSQPPAFCQLQVKLLLQFVENLDKLMYSAYEGAAVSLPPFPKAVRLFFRTNKSTCQEWLSRIRGVITSVSMECGEPATAVYHGLQRLKELKNGGKGKERDFELTALAVAKALCQLKASEALQGLSTWCKKHCERDFPWLEVIVHKSNGRYEKAICEYEKCLQVFETDDTNEGTKPDTSSNLSSTVLNFLVNEITDCYTKLTDWSEVEQWQKTVQEMRGHLPNPEYQQAANIKIDMNYVRALHNFEDGEFVGVRECLELIPGASLSFIIDRIGGSPLTLGKEESKSAGYTFTPPWSPQQVLQASDIFMMQALTLYWTSGMAGGGTKKDEVLRNEIHDLLSHGSDLLEGVITNGAKDWPPSISEIHAVQYYGINLLSKVLSGKHEEDKSHFMPFSSNLQTKSSSRSSLDSGVMCKILQITAYNHYHHKLHGKYQDETGDQLSTIQLATIRTARKERNFRLAYKHLRLLLSVQKDQTSTLTKEEKASLGNLPRGEPSVYTNILCESLCEDLTALQSTEMQTTTKSCIYNESAKLLHALGHTTKAADVLCCSLLEDKGKESKMGYAKTLCTLGKWFLGDRKVVNGSEQLKTNLLKVLNFDTEGVDGAEGIASVDDVDVLCGRVFSLSSKCAPDLDKAWFMLAGWAYKAGRKVVEQACSGGSVEISRAERETIIETLPEEMTSKETEEILSILSKGHFTTVGAQDEEINSGNEILTREEETVRKQLIEVSQSFSESCVESLVVIWRGICERLFSHYRTAVNAYFKYLRLHGKTSVKSDVDSDRHVTATLRLLRLLVKHAGGLKYELEQGFHATPTAPWEEIIPQLFSRLNHPEEYVRKGVTELLCRVSKDSPHLILYSAIVGCSGNNLRHDRNTNSLMTLVASRSDDPDNSFNLEDEELNFDFNQEQTLQSGYHTIVESLADGNSRLLAEVQDFVLELRRVTLLWEELWLGSLIQIHHDFEKRENQLNDEIKRVNSSTSLSGQEKSALIKGKHIALMKPIVFALEQLQSITNKQPETPHESWFQKTYSPLIENALHALKNPEEPSKPQTSWAKFRQLLQSLQQRSQKRSSVNLKLEEISPKLCQLNPSFIYMPGQKFSLSKVVTVNSLENDVVILPTKTRPKKIVLVGSDGQKYMYLFKGLEDLHLDERIMQFLSICNNMFAKPNRCEENLFLARHYSVTPLGPRSGLIQWVDGAVPIFSLYKRWQQRDAAATVALTKNEHGAGFTTTPKAPLRPNELFYNKLTPLLKEKNIDVSGSNRKDWPLAIMRKVLQELVHETPQDLLEKELWCSSTCISDWWKMSQRYSRSVAVMSIIGYILGLGDRHLDNMLIDFTTGEIVHIDYNICFEKGRGLRVPEKVPFRLTANLETALGVTGVEGTFRSSCEKVLRVLRNGRETLLTLLEAFVYDPLVDWTTGSDNAFANAFYGGQALHQQDVKQSKKVMERTITQCLFSSRVAEMRASWRGNRDSMNASLNNLKEAVDSHFSTVSQSMAVFENDKELLGQMEILQAAVKSTSHPLHAVQAKYDEQANMINDLNSVLQTIQERLKDCQQWDVQHQAALDTVRGTKLANIASELVKPLDVGLPSFAPAIVFLQNAGQSNTVSQCEQVETELTGLLHKRRSLLRACLDVIHTYATVISQFPATYSHNIRSSYWQTWLKQLIENSSTAECRAILQEYENKHNSPVSVDDDTVALINVESKLQNIFNEQKSKFAKFFERRNQEKVETTFLNNTATEAFQKLKQFVHENGKEGRLATMHVMVTGLASLHKRCLVMENTARVAGSRLLELVSRDGDWFLEELCSMTGNVMQFATFARTYWMDALDPSNPCVQDAVKSVQALASVYQMYKSLQDMMTNFRNIIVPETMKCLEVGDPTVLEVLGNFQEIISSCDLSIEDMIQTAHSVASKKANDSLDIPKITAAAIDLEEKIMKLLSTGKHEHPHENGESEHKIQMSAGQMLLAGFNGLFTKLESEVDALLVAVEHVDPEFDDGIDVYKEVCELRVDNSEDNGILKTLYLLKRLNVMKMFFTDCLRHVKNLCDSSSERQPDHILSEDQLSVYVRRYIADFVQERMLGLPSFVLTKTIVQWLSLIGLDIPKNLKENANTLENLCKKTVDQNIRQELFSATVLSQANDLTGSFNTAWRKHDFARRLDLNVTLYRCVVQRAQLSLARFQWFHEDILHVAPVRGNTMITPTRATVMSDLRKRVQNLLSLDVAMSSVQEKFTQLESSIEQRLKWAAGANPSLNPILKNFEHTLRDRKRLIVIESKYSSDICGISNAILHFEAFRTRTQEALAADQALAVLVHRCEECSSKVEKSQDSLKDVEDLMAKINVTSPPSEPITLEWMKTRLSNIKEDLVTNHTQKSQVDKYIAESKEHLRSQIAVVKAAWTAHQVLMGEVKSMLQSLAKDEEAVESVGARTFITNHNKLNEVATKMLKDILNICSSNGGGRSSNDLDETKNNYQQTEVLNSINSVHAIATWIFEQLPSLASPLVVDAGAELAEKQSESTTLTFASALRQGGQQTVAKETVASMHLDSGPPLTPALKEALSPLQVSSPTRQTTPGSIVKKSSTIRDPRTGKAVQERNMYAIGVWKRVKAKLDGRDIDPTKRMSVEDQVDHIIEDATSKDNLCLMYEGWTPWV